MFLNELVFLVLSCMFYSAFEKRGQQVSDRIAADCLATAASRCVVASCVLRRQMFRSLKQCVKQSCPPQEEQQGDMLLFINRNAFSPLRRGRAALFLLLREEVALNSLRYMWHLALCHLRMFVGVCLCVCTHIETDYTLIRVAKMLLKSSNLTPEHCKTFPLPYPVKWRICDKRTTVFTEEEVL